jgi:hypothetical protein
LRYFFHFVSDYSIYEDTTGQSFSSLEDALVEARSIAARSEPDAPPGHDQFISLVNSKGEELARVRIGARGIDSA